MFKEFWPKMVYDTLKLRGLLKNLGNFKFSICALFPYLLLEYDGCHHNKRSYLWLNKAQIKAGSTHGDFNSLLYYVQNISCCTAD